MTDTPADPESGDLHPAEALPAPEITPADARALLVEGRLDVEGRLVDASNATLFCTVEHRGIKATCVYKPVRGERPLWDFPDGTLAGRELAAFVVSEATGWNLVPPTVHRDGPFGPGMCQLWVEPNSDADLIGLAEGRTAPVRRMVIFDAVINNADRKGPHLLPQPGGHVYGCDHGISFHAEDKLRTVLWSFAGQSIDAGSQMMLSALAADLDGALGARLDALLTRREVAATRMRVARLLDTGRFPEPSGEWPAIPWPPF